MRARAVPWLALLTSVAQLTTHAQTTDGRLATALGGVYDSLTSRPLPGATIQLAAEVGGAIRTTTGDIAGSFRFDSVTPGAYLLTFFHPKLDSLGVEAPVRRVQLGRGEATTVTLAVPSARTLVRAACGATRDDSASAIVGDVIDADSGEPLPGAIISARWEDIVIRRDGIRSEVRQTVTTADAAGVYWLCGAPPGSEVAVRAAAGRFSTPWVEVELPMGAIVRRDLAIGRGNVTVAGRATRAGSDSVRRGDARASGTVTTEEGQPLANVQVFAWGSGTTTSTDSRGAFELTGLPSGTQVFEFRRVAHAPKRVVAAPSRRAPAVLNLWLDRVTTLAAMETRARMVYSRLDEDILRRQRSYNGRVISAEEIERRAASRLSDVLRPVPGLRVMTDGLRSIVVMSRGTTLTEDGCIPTVYLDDIRITADDDIDMIPITDVRAIEVYTSALQAPPDYDGRGCGSVVIWTKMGVRDLPRKPKQ